MSRKEWRERRKKGGEREGEKEKKTEGEREGEECIPECTISYPCFFFQVGLEGSELPHHSPPPKATGHHHRSTL